MGENVSANRKPQAMNCDLCCNETFDSLEALKIHIIEVLRKLKCPTCKQNSNSFENFTKHLGECESETDVKIEEPEITNEGSSDVENNTSTLQDSGSAGKKIGELRVDQDVSVYYCEICDVYFGDMKKHLMDYHIGQQIVVESEDLDEIFDESDRNSLNDAETATKTNTNTKESEHIVLEEEISNDNGNFYTKKHTKINIISDQKIKVPNQKEQTPNEIPKDGNLNVNKKLVYQCQDCDTKFSELSNYNKHECTSEANESCDISPVHSYTDSEPELSPQKENYNYELEPEITILDIPPLIKICKDETKSGKVNLGLSRHLKYAHSKTQSENATSNVSNKELKSLIHKRVHAPIKTLITIDPPATYNKVSEMTDENFTSEISERAKSGISQHTNKFDWGKLQSELTVLDLPPLIKICKDETKSSGVNLGLSPHKKNGTQPEDAKPSPLPHLKYLPSETQSHNATCDVCNKEFKSKHSLQLHKRVHAPKKTLMTIDPPATYDIIGNKVSEMKDENFAREISERAKSILSQHTKKFDWKNSSQNVICKVCNIVFKSKKSLMIHMRVHAPINTVKSIDPPVTYNINGNKVSEETDEIFTCEICGRQYNKKYEEDHMKAHNEEIFTCSICNREFSDKNDLAMHIQAHGTNILPKINCRFCKKDFLPKESLDDHIKNDCKARLYSCKFCGRKFLRAYEKIKHERIHTGLKPYICQICGKAFRISHCLTLHMRTHSGIRPYKCEICDKRYKSHGTYRHHLQTHSDVRSFQCSLCPKAFKTSVQLAGHRNFHTKPFSCKVCNRPFAELYTVRKHMKSHNLSKRLKHKCHICGAEYSRVFGLTNHLATHPDYVKEDTETMPRKIEKLEVAGKRIKVDANILDSSSEELQMPALKKFCDEN